MMDIHILLAVLIYFLPLDGVLYLAHHLCGVITWLRSAVTSLLVTVEQFMVILVLRVCCYLVALLGEFFPFGWNPFLLFLQSRVAMVTQHELKVHSMWHI